MIANLSAIPTRSSYHRERRSSAFPRPSAGYPCLERLKRRRPDVKVIFNVGGRRFVTWKNTLKRFPGTLLGSEELVSRFYDKDKKEYFIDRDPHLFRYILNYYRCGKLHRSFEDCNASFEEELLFYGIRPQEVHDCCFDDDHEQDNVDESRRSAKGNPCTNSTQRLQQSLIARARNWVWVLLEGEAESGLRAFVGMVIIYIIGLFIILSIFTAVYETIPCEGNDSACSERTRILDLLDGICVGVFTVEFLTRLLVCPNFVEFAKSPMNIIDFLSILPFYLTLLLESVIGSNLEAFVLLRVLRIFRVFKLTRHSKRLQRFGAAIASCVTDLMSLTFVLLIAVVVFSSMIYFIERNAVEGKFISIPDSMWYTIVTMITLGYGDIVPSTLLGKIVGAVCCVSGVILIALPIPIIQEKDIFKKQMLSVYNVDNLHSKIRQMKTAAERPERTREV
ncbi:potassium voltage-gated channel protein Shal-like [Montipora capricornis]|uniref:potassium voltage-gated channel protein Shal-like n=1 Tax=Montipora capricornis TaxID=246305 RepID=UPI0035F18A3B